MTWKRLSCLAGLCLVFCSCKSAPDTRLFEHAEYLVLEQRYEEAIPVLKQFLLDHPRHSGAHYYLGRCYFASKESFWFALAEGEILTAQALFERDGKKSTIARFSDVYFEFICHLDIAKTRLRQAVFLAENLGDFSSARWMLDLASESVERARKVAPESPDLPQVEQLLADFKRTLELPGRRTPIPKPRGTVI